jgi:hypothetical protein
VAVESKVCPGEIYPVGGKDPSGNLKSLELDASGNLKTVGGGGGGGGDGAIVDGASAAIKATVFDRLNANPLATQLVDSNGDPVSVGGGTQYTEDAASVADPVGTQVIARRRDTLATETSLDGDVTAVNSTGKGELYVKHVDSIPVTGPVTDAQLRATPVPVSGTVTASGPLTDAQLRATAVPVSGPLTDAQLRATPVPVSGTVTASGPLTDAQLRATAVPVSGPLQRTPTLRTITLR